MYLRNLIRKMVGSSERKELRDSMQRILKVYENQCGINDMLHKSIVDYQDMIKETISDYRSMIEDRDDKIEKIKAELEELKNG